MIRRNRILIASLIIIAICLPLDAFFIGRMTSDKTPVTHVYADSADPEKAAEIAENYLAAAPYSEKGLVETLMEYELFPEKTAKDAVASLDADWDSQAIREIKEYLLINGISQEELTEYMTRDQYTKAQIRLAIDACDPDWNEQALAEAKKLTSMGVKTPQLGSTLLKHGFTEEETLYALDNI